MLQSYQWYALSPIPIQVPTLYRKAKQCYSFTATKDMQRYMFPNLYVNETGLLPGMGKLNDFSSYSYVYMYRVVHKFCNPHGLLLRLIMTSDALVHLNVY